ncbi:MAG: stage II sporulation protein D, partial [bacterium]|nr:stage II sporulation protein D [bacterium]
QAVLARTYALKAIKENKKLTDTTSTQVYIDNNEMKSKWGSDYNKYYSKIKQAVESTKSVYVTYNNELIDAVYHAISNGMTEDAINVWGHSIPYLKSVDSSYDKAVSGYSRSIIKTDSEILKIFGIDSLDNIEILSRNSSGRVSSVRVGDSTYTGVDIRTLLGLRSSDFDMEIVGENIKITTRGYGHGVGMSQYGANSMAKNGSTYEQIIKHYYSGVKINK